MALGLAVPGPGDGAQSAFEVDPEGAALVLALFGVPIVVGLSSARRSPVMAGVAAGASLLFGAVFSFIWSYTLAIWVEFGDEVQVGADLALVILGSVLLFAASLYSMRFRRVGRDRTQGHSPVAVLGAATGLVTAVGLSIPTNGATFDQWLGFADYPLLGLSALIVLGSFVFVSLAGFLGGRWGVGLVLGFVGVLGVAALISDDDYDAGLLSELVKSNNDFHPLAKAGFWTMTALMVVHMVMLLSRGGTTQGSVYVGQQVSPAQWSADPFGRHQQRYWDGWAWTQHVSDGAGTLADPPVANAAPVMSPAHQTPPPPVDHSEPPLAAPAFRPPPPVGLQTPLPDARSRPSVWSASPAAAAPLADERTMSRSELEAFRRGEAPPQVAAPKPPVMAPVWTIRFDTGDALRLSAVTVIGRDPSPGAIDGGVDVHPLADPSMSVSKSHFAVGPQPDGVWVEDLGSVNGTIVVTEGGFEMSVAPGQRLPILPGTTVRFGERWCRVE